MEINSCSVPLILTGGFILLCVLLAVILLFTEKAIQYIHKFKYEKFLRYFDRIPAKVYIGTICFISFLLIYTAWPSHIEFVACGEQPKQEKQMLGKRQLSSGVFLAAYTCSSQSPKKIHY